MACAACAARQHSQNLRMVSKSAKRQVLQPTQECNITREQIEIRLSELESLKELEESRARRYNLGVKIFKLKKILRDFSSDTCYKYLTILNELL